MTIDTASTFLVATSRLAEMKKKLDRVARRANKLGVRSVAYSVSAEVVQRHFRLVQDPSGESWVSCASDILGAVAFGFQEVTVSGPAPRLAGWKFAGTLQHLEVDGETTNVLRTITEVPAVYRHVAPGCDHCKLNRRRNDTFLVVNEAGEWHQVGRSCLQDFVGGEDPADVVASCGYLLDMLSIASDFSGNISRGIVAWSHEEFLVMVLRAMACQGGFISKGAARDRNVIATANLAWSWMKPVNCEVEAARSSFPETEAMVARVEQALSEGMEILEAAERNDYLHNLWVAMKQPNVTAKLAGLVASYLTWYDREMGRIATVKQQRNESSHVGAVGAKVTVNVVVTSTKLIDGVYGTKVLHRMVDEDGNVFIWWCSGKGALQEGNSYSITGAIKSHDAYNGVKQTTLLRVTGK